MKAGRLAEEFTRVRAASLAIAAPLSAEDCGAQSMPDASPIKWHLAHSTWFFETFVLERFESGVDAFDPAFRTLFNSYYNGVGAQHPRAQRGMLTRPSLERIHAWRRNVDERVARLLTGGGPDPGDLVTLGLNHEEQHQELMHTDIRHLFSRNPLYPAYTGVQARHTPAADGTWLDFAGGLVDIGHRGDGFAFDNERPAHRVFLTPYRLHSRLVTNGEFLRFVDAGGYAQPAHWLSEGWDWLRAGGIRHPLYWREAESGWREFTLAGELPLDPFAPACCLSYFEADAYARWAGARLPTEFEWEHAAGSATPPAQLFDAAWQWTSSSYGPYPGYRPAAGAIGEYNGKFMVNQMVLRGGSSATPAGHSRITYRNFFPAPARWQFAGLRLARDAGGDA